MIGHEPVRLRGCRARAKKSDQEYARRMASVHARIISRTLKNTTSNATDNVFSDGTGTEMATVTGSVAAGFLATLRIVVSA
jgi:hypothetical protein